MQNQPLIGVDNETVRSRRRAKRLNATLFGSHIAVMAVIVGILVIGYRAPVEASPSLASQTVFEPENITVDQIAAATVAADVAQTLDLSVENNVEDLAGTLSIQAELAQTDNTFLNKPQIIEENSGRTGISRYHTKAGDTVPELANQFGISEDTIRWANHLTGDALRADRTLLIPGTTGVVYTVQPGDTLSKLANHFSADRERIVTYNDLELSGLQEGVRIVIPGGVLPAAERPGFTAVPVLHATVYGGNSYAYGYCTWYAYNRRAELGRPVGSNWHNASTWDDFARAAGFRVDHSPSAGAVMQDNFGWGGLGHVSVVERVNSDGGITVSEMNYAGWNVISSRHLTAEEAAVYNYIH